MTHFKQELRLNPKLALIQTTLSLGLEAAQQQNWSLVNHYLRLLPLANKPTSDFIFPDSAWQVAFKLALGVLLNGDFQQQWEVAKILPLLGTPIIDPLILLLEDEAITIEARWFICQVLGNFNHEAIAIALIKLLQHTEEPELIDIAGKTLTKIGTKAIAVLVDLLSQPKYRALAAQSLAYIRHPEIITPLLTIVNDPQPEVRTVAVEALGSFHDDRIPPVLINALQDTSSSVRKEAAIALGFRPDLCTELNLVGHLQPLLYDLSDRVCNHAAISLGRMQNESAATALFNVLQSVHTPLTLKQEIVRALVWSDLPVALDYLQQALVTEAEPIALEIVAFLGRVSPSLKAKAARILTDYWHSAKLNQTASPKLKQIIATSWGELGCHSASAILKELTADSDKKVQLHAISALNKLK